MNGRATRRRRGAGMTEYIIIVGLCAAGLIGVVKVYKWKVDETITGTANAMSRGMDDNASNNASWQFNGTTKKNYFDKNGNGIQDPDEPDGN